MTGQKIPRWEAELWSYVGSGDGEQCPLYDRCRVSKECGWCPDEHKERLNQLFDDGQCTLHSCDFIESQGGRPGRLFQLVELMAQKYLKKGKVDCPPVPTVLIALIDPRAATEVRQLPLKAYHGAIWHPKEGWIIQLKADDTSATKRFTVFHEAFHILAHCRTTPVFRKRGAIQGSFNELLADYFATGILMPREWVKEKWAEVKDLDRMAEIFDVPTSAMCIRLRQLGLV
ncbi:hypothetical protein ES703_63957 [subsurface metagenome]